jgi:hypothetical protein
MQCWDLYENIPEIPPGEGGQKVDNVSDAQNGLSGLLSQLAMTNGPAYEIEHLMNLVRKIKIEDTEENKIALADAYREGYREGTTQVRYAELAALNKADRQTALEVTLSSDTSEILGGISLAVR